MSTTKPRRRHTSEGRRLLVLVLGKMTATALARATGVAKTAISALSTGVHAYPSLPLALELARFGIPPAAWLEPMSSAEDYRSPYQRADGHEDAARRGAVKETVMPTDDRNASKIPDFNPADQAARSASEGSPRGGELVRKGNAEVERSRRESDAAAEEHRKRVNGPNSNPELDPGVLGPAVRRDRGSSR